jgi:ribosome maturation factor RimP
MAHRERGAARASAGRPGRDLAPSGQLERHRARLRDAIEPVVAAAALDLEDLSVSRAGRRQVVRVIVDGDGGVGHDALGTVSRDISAALDEAEEKGGEFPTSSYILEVSSPGVDRPLTQPRHWRRNIGRLVKVKVGERTVTARVAAVDDTGVTLEAQNGRTSTVMRSLPWGELGPGRVQVEFSRLDGIDDEDLGEAFDGEDGDSAQPPRELEAGP